MKLWDKGYTTDNLVDRFTVGNDRILDLKLAKHDIAGNVAHAKMLHKINILTELELKDILSGLAQIQETIDLGTFTIEENFEDVHSKVEFELVKLIGDAGKKIHTARSRNDQVLVDLHLYVKEEIERIISLTSGLFDTLLKLGEKYKNVLIPGYTHMQVAMPSSFGLWFSAYGESLIDDVIMLKAAHKISDQNPLGSAAGYGTSFPIDRSMTTELLGFESMKYNVVAAQLSRGKLEKTTAFAIASLAGTLSKLSADVCLYMSQNFNFLGFPKELTTGSSIMPHKQNPDVFELMRAKCNKLQNMPSEIMMITNNLTSGYHRDFQLLKENLMVGIDTMKDNLEVCNFMLQQVIIKDNILDNDIYDYLYSVEEVNKLVLKGMTFRDAYQKLGREIMKGDFKPDKKVEHTHEGSIGNLCLKEIKAKFNKL
ncbi:argininosuccinate lyase [Putridiphycobacter roseus]|uniref:Argininosuccinate lyase n=1 Tax=Putridiphycobacter roseus TaxID=2219161 RepID=A0A2W1N2A4_9FLAO|nr:argininosuccinate lyase [Putridiphycobacter roseus]PZE17660.1 argininosuccinate lyase [Putridiphycobacter roseus]